MSEALAGYRLKYEDYKPKSRKSGGKDIIKMSKNSKQTEAPAKVYNKTRGEHLKDLVIVALVVSIIAFIGGMQFAEKQNAKVSEAVKAVTPTASAEASK